MTEFRLTNLKTAVVPPHPQQLILDGRQCGYCSGLVVGELVKKHQRIKIEPPPGAIDMNIYHETKYTQEIYSCNRCGRQFLESDAERVGVLSYATRDGFMKNKVGLVFYRCHGADSNDMPILPDQSLTMPHLPVVLVQSDNSNRLNGFDGWRYKCTACTSCSVCSQFLRSRNIVFAHVQGADFEDKSEFTYHEYFYAHAECREQLIPRVTVLYQEKQKDFVEKNKSPKRWGWW